LRPAPIGVLGGLAQVFGPVNRERFDQEAGLLAILLGFQAVGPLTATVGDDELVDGGRLVTQ
jgi:hypothetical protein